MLQKVLTTGLIILYSEATGINKFFQKAAHDRSYKLIYFIQYKSATQRSLMPALQPAK